MTLAKLAKKRRGGEVNGEGVFQPPILRQWETRLLFLICENLRHLWLIFFSLFCVF